MFIPKAVKYFVLLVGVSGSYFDLSELTQRILKEADTTTVYFLNMDSEFVGGFMKDHGDAPVAILTNPPSGTNKHFTQNYATLVVQARGGNHQNFAMSPHFIRRLRVHKFVIISADNLAILQQHFDYFWENKFTRIFGIAENISYAYLPFADFPVQPLYKGDPIPDALKDLNGFTLRTSIPRLFPSIFWYPDRNGQKQLGGIFGKLFQTFVQRHNATFKETLSNDYTKVFLSDIRKAIRKNDMDISTNGFPPAMDLSSSYPVIITEVLLLVPLNGYVNPNEYFMRPFTPAAWVCIGLTLVYIIAMDLIKDIYTHSHADVWQSFSRIFMMMIGSCTERPLTSAYRFYGQVLLLGFILGNFYIIYCTSFLTVFIKVKQYDTIQDLIDNNVRVMFPQIKWNLISNSDQHREGFERIVYLVDYPIYARTLYALNDTRFAYPAYAFTVKFNLGPQAHTGKPLFHPTRDRLTISLLSYMLPPHSPFKEILDSFIIRILQTGLIPKWNLDAIAETKRAGHEVYVDHSVQPENSPLTVDNLHFAWICLVVGLVLALTVFLAEISGFFIIIQRSFVRGSRAENVVYLP